MTASLILCTTFLLGGVVGKSYDWGMGQGLVLVNKRGVAKQALPMKPGDKPARWVSKHASITFNQYGREMPNGGMNDAGLVVEVMWLDASEFEKPDDRPSVSELQWIQYQLDSFASVDEMVKSADQLRVSLIYGKVHYLACDKTRACASFEYVKGKQVVTPGAKVLTNHTYADAKTYAARQESIPNGGGSLDRFVRAGRLAEQRAGASSQVIAAFTVLDSVRGSDSQWNIVYDPVALKVHFRTLTNKKIKSLDFGSFDKSCASAVKLLDIDADLEGDVTARFVPYNDEANRKLIERSVRDIAGKLPKGAVDQVVKYPSMLACSAP
jgi:penicillin V acylase-like amidase (Ntn superfamily)